MTAWDFWNIDLEKGMCTSLTYLVQTGSERQYYDAVLTSSALQTEAPERCW